MTISRFLTAVALLLFTGCSSELPERPIRVSANSWIGYEPFFIAETLEYYPPGSVHLIETPFSLTLEQALRGGTIDASALSLSRAISLHNQGFDISIVLVLDWSNGADKILAKPGLNSMAALKGKRVASEANTVNSYLLARALQQYGMSENDIIPVSMLNEAMDEAYEKGEIDAASVFGPVAEAMQEQGAELLFDSSEIPGEIIDVLVIRNAYLRTNSNQVKKLIRGWLRAVAYLEQMEPGAQKPPGLLTNKNYYAAVNGIRFAGLEDNQSFLEADATRLRAILNARIQSSPPSNDNINLPISPPPVVTGTFMEILREGKS